MGAFRKIISKIEIQSAVGEGKNSNLDSDDMRPTLKSDRTWGLATWMMFWLSAISNASAFMGAGAALAAGLTVWEGLWTAVIGNIVIAILMALNGRAGAVYGVNFGCVSRAAFGIYGAMWPLFNRAVMACVWQGVNAVAGAQALYMTLYAIFPSIARVPNTMSSSSALTSAQLICFFVFCVLTAGCCFLSVPRWKIFIHLKVGMFAMSCIALLAFTLTKSGGLGDTFSRPSTLSGSERAWTIGRFILLTTAACATFISNAADFQRTSRSANAPLWGQMMFVPSGFLVGVLALIVAASSQKHYGEVEWNSLIYVTRLLEEDYSPKSRCAVFFIGSGFVYSSLFSAIFENLLPFANDVVGLLPRWVNLKRGFFLCIASSIIINPWYLLGSAVIFISVLASYQIFLFAIIGVLLVNYYLIMRGEIDIEELYDSNRDGMYWYTKGVNWRAFVAYFVSIAPNFPGFLQNLGVIEGNVTMARSYYFALYTTGTLSGLVFYGLTKFFPVPCDKKTGWREPKVYYRLDDPARFEGGSEESIDSIPATPMEEKRDEKDLTTVSIAPVLTR